MFPFHRALPVEHPAGPIRGYKLAYPLLSLDGHAAGFGGIWPSTQTAYGIQDHAVCFWNKRHSPPKRGCSCGFYCLRSLEAARAMACQSKYRSTVLLDVDVSGRFIRFENGFRYSSQRVQAIRLNRCLCGRPASVLVDNGTGITGWRRLQPCCVVCSYPKETLTTSGLADLLGGTVPVMVDIGGDPAPGSQPVEMLNASTGASPSLSVLSAEVALMQARIDELQAQVARLSGS